jgi:hypothetical protein
MEINKNLSKLIFREFDDSIKGTDIYNHDGSMWLIFTEERKWVIEFTNQKTLWYNYKHFTDILVLFGMEVSEGAEYIKKWYEDKFIFNVVKNDEAWLSHTIVDNVIDNGVKETISNVHPYPKEVRDIIQNGVKKVDDSIKERLFFVEDTIQNGVKETKGLGPSEVTEKEINSTIQNGVKNTELKMFLWREVVEDIIQNGVKDVQEIYENTLNSGLFEINCKKVIKKGVKYVFEGKMQAYLVNDVIEDGVKEVDYYDGDAEILVNEAIENGVKEVMDGTMQPFLINDVLRDGIKHIDYSLLGSIYQKDHNVTTLDFTSKLEDTIKNGVKEISSVDCEYPRTTINVIKNGEKLKD